MNSELLALGVDCAYTRGDVDFDTWYAPWPKTLAKRYTLAELVRMLHGNRREAGRAAESHHRAVARTTSMNGNSQARAHSRNTVAAAGDRAIALRAAIEIHVLFPEHAKSEVA